MKKVTAFVLVFCMLFALAACASDSGTSSSPSAQSSASASASASASESASASASANTEPIKIGHIVDLTGSEAATGAEAERALQFAIDALGGEFAGRPVEVIVGDAAGDTATAVDQARKMVESDGVVAIFGPTQAGQKTAVAEYAAGAGVPLIFYNGTPSALFEGNKWLVGAGGDNRQMPSVIADYSYNELGYRTVTTISMDNVGFRTFIESYIAFFEKLGGTAVQQQYAPLPTSDWSSYLVNLSDADAIMAWATGSNAISLFSAWYEMGTYETMPITAIMHGGFTDYFVLNAVSGINPEIAEAILGTIAPICYVYDIDTPENEAFVEAWVAEYDSVPQTNLPGLCYQAALLLKTAVEDIDGDTTPENLIDAIFSADINGPTGHLYFEDSQAATMTVYIAEVVRLEDGSYNYCVVKTYKDVPPTGYVS